ncbi:hypothetical protein MIMGU_mgv1a018399mg, partial [Erythranthe guttata]
FYLKNMDWNISPRSPVNDTVEIDGHDSLIALLNESMNYEHHTDYVPEPTPPYTDFDSETTPYCSKPIPIIDDDEEDDNNDYDDDVQYKGTKPSASSNLTPPMSKGKGKGKTNESKETKRTSIWLDYFRISKDAKTGNDVAECKKCKHVLSAKANAGTSHLKRHAEKHLKDMQNSTTQTQLSDSGFTSHRKIERSEIVRYIIHKGDSFSTPSHPAFVRLMRHANGHYDPHSRPTITRDSYKEFEKFRQPLIDELSTLKLAGTAMRKYEEVEKLLYSLYEEYKKVFGTNISISSSSQSSSKKNRKSTWSLLEEDDVRSSGTNELVRYLEFRSYHNTPEEYESLDILKWWQENAHHYPVVSMMARDLLNTPVSTVASEAAFSAGGKILTAERNRLSPRNVEALVCTQDWIEAELRNQERSQQQNNQGKDDDSPDEYDIRGEFSGEGY